MIKILVPSYISEEEKANYLTEFFNKGYKVVNVYDYDADYDVYCLELK